MDVGGRGTAGGTSGASQLRILHLYMRSSITLAYQKGCLQACRCLHAWRMRRFLPHIVKTQKHSREVMLHSRQSGSLPHRILSSREEDSYPTSRTSCESGHCELRAHTGLPGAARWFCCQPNHSTASLTALPAAPALAHLVSSLCLAVIAQRQEKRETRLVCPPGPSGTWLLFFILSPRGPAHRIAHAVTPLSPVAQVLPLFLIPKCSDSCSCTHLLSIH